METSTISSKGWIVFPGELRKKYGLTPGTRVQVVDYGGILSLVPVGDNPVQQAVGLMRGKTSLTQALLDEHAQERSRDR
jgi:AbrB family looped-hinge helix DNA binding protein